MVGVKGRFSGEGTVSIDRGFVSFKREEQKKRASRKTIFFSTILILLPARLKTFPVSWESENHLDRAFYKNHTKVIFSKKCPGYMVSPHDYGGT